MQQHLMHLQPKMAGYYTSNVTSDHIQQYLDENKSLILKIVESQNSGKLSECAENQARLQRNLMYLASIADSQSRPPNLHSQYGTSGGGMIQGQGGSHYFQQQEATHQQQMTTHQSLMAARPSMLYAQHQQPPYATLQHQQLQHSQLGMDSSSSGLHIHQGEAGGVHEFCPRKLEMGSGGGGEGRGGSSGDGTGETLYLK